MSLRSARSSLSAYYYSGARDLMVGTICAIGTFLLAYKVAERNLDNTLSVLAGLTVILVALFPPRVRTGRNPSPHCKSGWARPSALSCTSRPRRCSCSASPC